MIIMKFGGTSVANCEAITRAIDIIRGRLDEKPVVVVSALSKVTDLLYKLSDAAAAKNRVEVENLLGQLRDRHITLAKELLEGNDALCGQACAKVNEICDSLGKFVSAVCALGELSDRSKAVIISNGEYLSSNIICFALNARGIVTNYIDARSIIITSRDYLKGEPVSEEIIRRTPGIVSDAFKGADTVITQGFVSATPDGEPTVLGRGGSDYSASLIGMAVDAQRIEIWTDVDGVRTADPRRVQNTKCLDKISFEEAADELDESGRQRHGHPAEFFHRRRSEVDFLQGKHQCHQHLLNQDDKRFRLPEKGIRDLQREQSVSGSHKHLRGEHIGDRGLQPEHKQGREPALGIRRSPGRQRQIPDLSDRQEHNQSQRAAEKHLRPSAGLQDIHDIPGRVIRKHQFCRRQDSPQHRNAGNPPLPVRAGTIKQNIKQWAT